MTGRNALTPLPSKPHAEVDDQDNASGYSLLDIVRPDRPVPPQVLKMINEPEEDLVEESHNTAALINIHLEQYEEL